MKMDQSFFKLRNFRKSNHKIDFDFDFRKRAFLELCIIRRNSLWGTHLSSILMNGILVSFSKMKSFFKIKINFRKWISAYQYTNYTLSSISSNHVIPSIAFFSCLFRRFSDLAFVAYADCSCSIFSFNVFSQMYY